MRILTLLYANKKAVSLNIITAVDLFSTYGKNYDMLETNLHGDNSYSFGEIASRRTLIQKALKSLALKGYISVLNTSKGFRYIINNEGEKLCSNIKSDYFDSYTNNVKTVMSKVSQLSEKEIIEYATRYSVEGGNN